MKELKRLRNPRYYVNTIYLQIDGPFIHTSTKLSHINESEQNRLLFSRAADGCSNCDSKAPGSEAGSYLRLIDSCISQLKAQGPSRTCNESKEEESACVPLDIIYIPFMCK